ncbi:hypothetical protein SUGI_1246930 [Cryptomeria japonica]|uniref:Uncharacterized protein n=1 Tax=Cryptomeria japonica TaxID=3369 RepID=A0AAD3NJY0_CRYJA|nr:hypothetical protein SUGI_1246930 [Cryptomeria japonica]
MMRPWVRLPVKGLSGVFQALKRGFSSGCQDGATLGPHFFRPSAGRGSEEGFLIRVPRWGNPWAAFFSSKCWARLRRGVSHPGAELGKTLGPHFFCPSVGRGFEEGFLIQGPSWATLGPHFFRPSVGRGFEEGFLIRGLHFFCPSAGRGSEEGFLIQVPSSATHVPHFFRPSARRGSEERKWKWGFGHYPRATFPSESLVRLFTVAAPHVRTGDFWVGASGAHYIFAQASSGVSGALRSGVIGAAPLFLSERLVGFLALGLPRPGCWVRTHPGVHEIGSWVNCPAAHQRCAMLVRTRERSDVCSKVRRARSPSPVCPGCAPRVHLRRGEHLGVQTLAGLRALVRTKERSEVCSKVRRARSRSPVCPGCAPRVHLRCGGHLGWVARLGGHHAVHEVGARIAPGAHLRQVKAAHQRCATLVRTWERSDVCSKVRRARSRSPVCPGCALVGTMVRTKERSEVCSKVRPARSRSPVCPGRAPRVGTLVRMPCLGCAPGRAQDGTRVPFFSLSFKTEILKSHFFLPFLEISEGSASKVRTSLPTTVRNAGGHPGVLRSVLQGAACTLSEPGLPRVRTSRAPSSGWAPWLGLPRLRSEAGLLERRLFFCRSVWWGFSHWLFPGPVATLARTKSEVGLIARVRTFARVGTLPGLCTRAGSRWHPRSVFFTIFQNGNFKISSFFCLFWKLVKAAHQRCAPRCPPWCALRCAPGSATKCAPRCGVHVVGARFAPGAHLACTLAGVGTLAGFAQGALRSGVTGAPPLFLSERLVGFLALALPRPGCWVRSHPGAREVGSWVNCPGAHLRQGGHLGAHTLAGLRTRAGSRWHQHSLFLTIFQNGNFKISFFFAFYGN